MYKTIVNSAGRMVELCVVERGGELLGYTLPSGCIAVSYINDALTVTNGVQHPPLLPRWDFGASAWVDDATAAELETAYPAVLFAQSDAEWREEIELALIELADIMTGGM